MSQLVVSWCISFDVTEIRDDLCVDWCDIELFSPIADRRNDSITSDVLDQHFRYDSIDRLQDERSVSRAAA
jgi:hypothetical protein